MANSCVSFLDTVPKWRVQAYSQANTDLNSKFFYCPKPLKRTLKTRRGWVVGGGNGLIRATLFSFVHTMHRIALATTRKPYRILSFHRPANPVFWLATQQARCGHIGTVIFGCWKKFAKFCLQRIATSTQISKHNTNNNKKGQIGKQLSKEAIGPGFHNSRVMRSCPGRC